MDYAQEIAALENCPTCGSGLYVDQAAVDAAVTGDLFWAVLQCAACKWTREMAFIKCAPKPKLELN